jgi:pimeloyl-ACP methyl ester carboxylesterase
MPYARVNEISMFYTDEGEGPPILLVHGWSCDGADWAWQTPALKAAGYRCIVPDLRGHGRSSVAEDGYGARQYAADLAELLRKLETGPVVAVGHSMGGAAVVALAVEHPDTVRAVVPIDAAYGFEDQTPGLLTELAGGFKGPTGHEAALAFAASAFYVDSTPPHLSAMHARRIAAFDQEVMWKAFDGLLNGEGAFGLLPASEVYLQRIAVPAYTFRAGKQDPTAVAQWELAQFQHPASKAVGWTNTGHWLHQERPEEFNQTLLGWLREIE